MYKKGDRSNTTNYRPISLLDILQKNFARLVLGRFEHWIDTNDILTHLQAGFRCHIRTVDQVFRLLVIIWKYINIKGEHLYIAFLDLRAAFDLVPRPVLWDTLRSIGIPGPLVDVISRLHAQNFAQVRWGPNGEISSPFPVDRGVRQGCVLAPTLFSLFINDVVESLTAC